MPQTLHVSTVQADLLLARITTYVALLCRVQVPVVFAAPMRITWGDDSKTLHLVGTKGDAQARFVFAGEAPLTCTVDCNSAYRFVASSLELTEYGFALDLLDTRIKQMQALLPPESVTTDCRSYDGITTGLVDSIITMARVLRHRDLSGPAVQEALKDLCADEDLRFVLNHVNNA